MTTEDIKHYRNFLHERFDGDIPKIINGLTPLLDSDTIRRLMNADYDGKFSKQTIKRLEWYVRGGEERSAYFNVLRRLDINSASVKTTIDVWKGKYRYFRFFSKGNSRDEHEYNYGGGKIHIENENNIPVFKHWSHNYEGDTPEHTGYVYKSDNHIFMLGAGEKKMRLAVAYNVNKPSDELIAGIVLSQRNAAPYNAFAARFLMVHEDNKNLIEKLSSTIPTTSEQNEINSTRGIDEFHKEIGTGLPTFL